MKNLVAKAAARFDAWYNAVTGIGTSADKAVQAKFSLSGVSDFGLWEALHVGDPIFGKIANKRPREAFRKGYTLEGDAKAMAALKTAAGLLGDNTPANPRLDAAVIEAWSLANAQGGAAILIRTTDLKPDAPLTAASKVVGFTVVAAQHIAPELRTSTFFTEGRAPTEFYILAHNATRVHRSRVVPFFGDYAPWMIRLTLNGWGVSKFYKPYTIVQLYMQGLHSIGGLLTDAAQGVFSIDGLWEMLTSEKDEALQKRMALVDRQRSSGRALLLDRGSEEFERVPTPMAGMAEALQELKEALALAADMPATELFGGAPSGLNATGEGEQAKWYDSIDQERVSDIAPRLLELYGAIALGEGIALPTGVAWGKLREPSAKEAAEVDKLRTDTATAAIENGTLETEEARVALASGAGLFSAVDAKAAAEDLAKRASGPDLEGEDPEDPEAEGGASMSGKTGKPGGAVALTATDMAEVVLVREARESAGLPPFGNDDDALTVAVFRMRQQAATTAELAAKYPTQTVTTPTAEAPAKPKGAPDAPPPPPAKGDPFPPDAEPPAPPAKAEPDAP